MHAAGTSFTPSTSMAVVLAHLSNAALSLDAGPCSLDEIRECGTIGLRRSAVRIPATLSGAADVAA